ncbi:MAG TPA: hypothetical protein VD902_21575, partial [Symbiobacteriaceae bacterium]|nr:hypothetical protein [Symbiobacteriaceae bacterium]
GALSNGTTGYSAIAYQGQVRYCCPGFGRRWTFLSDTLEPGATATYEFQQVHLANGTAPQAIQVEAVS